MKIPERTANFLGKLIFALVLAVLMRPASQQARAESICNIVKHGPNFDSKIVRFEGRYSTAPEDFPGTFYDNRCHGFIEDITRDDHLDSSFERFDQAQSGLPQNFDVEVSGKFHWNRHWQPSSVLLRGVVKPHPQGQIELTHIWKFHELKSAH